MNRSDSEEYKTSRPSFARTLFQRICRDGTGNTVNIGHFVSANRTQAQRKFAAVTPAHAGVPFFNSAPVRPVPVVNSGTAPRSHLPPTKVHGDAAIIHMNVHQLLDLVSTSRLQRTLRKIDPFLNISNDSYEDKLKLVDENVDVTNTQKKVLEKTQSSNEIDLKKQRKQPIVRLRKTDVKIALVAPTATVHIVSSVIKKKCAYKIKRQVVRPLTRSKLVGKMSLRSRNIKTFTKSKINSSTKVLPSSAVKTPSPASRNHINITPNICGRILRNRSTPTKVLPHMRSVSTTNTKNTNFRRIKKKTVCSSNMISEFSSEDETPLKFFPKLIKSNVSGTSTKNKLLHPRQSSYAEISDTPPIKKVKLAEVNAELDTGSVDHPSIKASVPLSTPLLETSEKPSMSKDITGSSNISILPDKSMLPDVVLSPLESTSCENGGDTNMNISWDSLKFDEFFKLTSENLMNSDLIDPSGPLPDLKEEDLKFLEDKPETDTSENNTKNINNSKSELNNVYEFKSGDHDLLPIEDFQTNRKTKVFRKNLSEIVIGDTKYVIKKRDNNVPGIGKQVNCKLIQQDIDGKMKPTLNITTNKTNYNKKNYVEEKKTSIITGSISEMEIQCGNSIETNKDSQKMTQRTVQNQPKEGTETMTDVVKHCTTNGAPVSILRLVGNTQKVVTKLEEFKSHDRKTLKINDLIKTKKTEPLPATHEKILPLTKTKLSQEPVASGSNCGEIIGEVQLSPVPPKDSKVIDRVTRQSKTDMVQKLKSKEQTTECVVKIIKEITEKPLQLRAVTEKGTCKKPVTLTKEEIRARIEAQHPKTKNPIVSVEPLLFPNVTDQNPQPGCSKTSDTTTERVSSGTPQNTQFQVLYKPRKTNSPKFPGLDQTARIIEAPVYRPKEDEFMDPFLYIDSIFPHASSFGMCKIIPPTVKKYESKNNLHLPGDIKFTANNQYLNRMYQRWGPATQELCTMRKHASQQGVPFDRPPLIDGIELNLPELFKAVENYGGLNEVVEKGKWMNVASQMRLNPAKKSWSILDGFYLKYLLAYGTCSEVERRKISTHVEEEWMKKYRKMVMRAQNPIHRQSRLVRLSASSESEDEDSDRALYDSDECVVKGRSMTISYFQHVAEALCSMFQPANEKSDAEAVEREYWSLVTKRTKHICVYAGAVDSGEQGLGWPKSGRNQPPWNLKNLSENKRSVLRSMGPVLGVNVPTIHLGMMFSTCCWNRDPHGLPWVEYHHTGATKIWYGIPELYSDKFRKAVKKLAPSFCLDKNVWLPSDVSMIPPELLLENGVSLSRITQEPGEMIVVFPRAYTSSVCTGYSVSESVYFGFEDWLAGCHAEFREAQDSCEPTMFPLEQLLLAIAADSRASPTTLTHTYCILKLMIDEEIEHREQLLSLYNVKVVNQEVNKSKKRPPRNQPEECDVCRTSLFLSKVIGLSGKNGAVCCIHATSIIQKKQKVNAPLEDEVTLIANYTRDHLNSVLEDLEGLVFPV